jgi:hypothetical protein
VNAIALRLLAVVLALLGSVAFGYQWGSTASDNAHQAEQNRAARMAQERFDAELLRGQAAVASLTTERQAHTANYTHLAEQFHDLQRRVRIVSRPHRADPVGAGAAAQDGHGAGPAADLSRPLALAADGGAGDGLSLGALWMWNSALAGADQPAGACGSADTSEAACAADSGVTLADAWRNHAINAQACAEDRLNHQRLIDFINAGQSPVPAREANP